MKYGTWNVAGYDPIMFANMQEAGFSPLSAATLCSRGFTTGAEATAFLGGEESLCDPMQLKDMDVAAERVRLAIGKGEKIAVYGDYDVDGITSTCLLTQCLQSLGAQCVYYIPSRIEDGYGLSMAAIDRLSEQGVELIVTVDCGITAVEEALYCEKLGIDLVITDHHECKGILPRAVAVVDPHRPDDLSPHKNLAGVGVAFKLASAIVGDQEFILQQYGDLVCLGTIADVMPILDENRRFVIAGLEAIQTRPRMGVLCLMKECECAPSTVNAGTIGYVLAPRINAAGRMACVEVAVELLLCKDCDRATELAQILCQRNRDRQLIEATIFADACEMLKSYPNPKAIVLASKQWHQGVVGIVASRLSEQYSCPSFLICLDGDVGKASSRSFGGFNLFGALSELSDYLEGYGGHELAAGFSIREEQIDQFRVAMEEKVAIFCQSDGYSGALEIDAQVSLQLLSLENVEELSQLEPCGTGCPKPLFSMENLQVQQMSEVGGGRHLRLKFEEHTKTINGMFFSTNALQSGVMQGDCVDVAFHPQVNEFRGTRSVQMNVVDIRPALCLRSVYAGDEDLYQKYKKHETLTTEQVASLIPSRAEFATLWRYIVAHATNDKLSQDCSCLCRKLSKESTKPFSLLRMKICLDVFAERGLTEFIQCAEQIHITVVPNAKKVSLQDSPILKQLNQLNAGG